MTNPPKNQPTFHINSVGNLNTGDVTIAGDQIGTQNIQQESQDTALLAIVQIIQALEKKYTFVQDSQQAIDIIDAEFKALEADRSPQWQNLLNVKRLYNGGKKVAVKVGEHFTQENVWGKGAVAFLEGISEDVK